MDYSIKLRREMFAVGAAIANTEELGQGCNCDQSPAANLVLTDTQVSQKQSFFMTGKSGDFTTGKTGANRVRDAKQTLEQRPCKNNGKTEVPQSRRNLKMLAVATMLFVGTLANAQTHPPTVYVAGYEYNDSVSVAKVWRDGVANSLTTGQYGSRGRSVFVSGNDVYVAGYESNGGKDFAKVWKNGSLLNTLSDGTQDAYAYSVYVSGNDIYVAGYESNGSKYVAKVWKNGNLLNTLSNGTQNAYAYSVYVSGNNVYVLGFEFNGSKTVAKVWKNGSVLYSLTDGTQDAYAQSIHVADNDVYVAGSERDAAKVWKNGNVLSTLTGGTTSAQASSIFVVRNFDVAVVANNNALGTVSGDGVYAENTTATLTATPAADARFVSWSDGNTDNPRAITVTQDTTFTAIFKSTICNVTVLANDNSLGTVSGGGTYAENATVALIALPNANAYFFSWSDGNTDNPHNITVTQDTTFTAFFVSSNSVDEITKERLQITLSDNLLNFKNVTVSETVQIYDVSGKAVISTSLPSSMSINIGHLPAGVYVVKVSNISAKFVKK
jgi:hypothetical protein